MRRYAGRNSVVIGLILLSGPLAFCVGTAVLGWVSDGGGSSGFWLPLTFVGLWVVYMGWWTFALVRMVNADRRRGFPVIQHRGAGVVPRNRMKRYL